MAYGMAVIMCVFVVCVYVGNESSYIKNVVATRTHY